MTMLLMMCCLCSFPWLWRQIDGPNNYKMYSVRNKADNTFQIRAVHSGDYKFCMENVEHMAASVDLNFHVGHHAPMKLQDVAKEGMSLRSEKCFTGCGEKALLYTSPCLYLPCFPGKRISP